MKIEFSRALLVLTRELCTKLAIMKSLCLSSHWREVKQREMNSSKIGRDKSCLNRFA